MKRFHGTVIDNVPYILKQGELGASYDSTIHENTVPGVYTTNQETVAVGHADAFRIWIDEPLVDQQALYKKIQAADDVCKTYYRAYFLCVALAPPCKEWSYGDPDGQTAFGMSSDLGLEQLVICGGLPFDNRGDKYANVIFKV